MAKVLKFEANTNHVCDVCTDYDKLSERCDEFDLSKKNKDVQEIVLKLKNTIRANEGMLGLSANQIGYDKRIICLNFEGNIRTFINPIITNAGPLTLSRETCHSEPGKEYIRLRHTSINVTYQTPLGKIDSIQLVGVASIIMQHHIDHLDGLMLSDIGLEIDEEFDKASEEEQQEVIDAYLDSLDLCKEQIKQDIENDEDAKQLRDGIRFIESVQKGETIIEEIPLTDEEIEELKKKASEEEQTKDE